MWKIPITMVNIYRLIGNETIIYLFLITCFILFYEMSFLNQNVAKTEAIKHISKIHSSYILPQIDYLGIPRIFAIVYLHSHLLGNSF